jgi:hypothetical protein
MPPHSLPQGVGISADVIGDGEGVNMKGKKKIEKCNRKIKKVGRKEKMNLKG